jgi:lipoprotein-anchoring transpeptidase ErfK/SrfK
MQVGAKRIADGEKQVARFIASVFVLVIAAHGLQAQAQSGPAESTAQVEHRRKLVVSIPHRKLALIENGKVKKIYPVAVGAAQSHSPTGTFQVENRLMKPTYYHPGKIIPAGPNNPLGTRWIGLSTKGYGIHGTNDESSIGKAASHGCIRMHRKDLEELFAAVEVGDEVEIRSEADPEIATIFGDPAETTDELAAAAGTAGDQQ